MKRLSMATGVSVWMREAMGANQREGEGVWSRQRAALGRKSRGWETTRRTTMSRQIQWENGKPDRRKVK
jgi:hypothetical protein